MNLVGSLFSSSIGRKILMAVTGLILIGFVIGHLVGNLQVFQHPEHINGYAEFLQAIADRHHPEHDSILQWAGGDYDPDAFNPSVVVFDNPRKRWRKAFEN